MHVLQVALTATEYCCSS